MSLPIPLEQIYTACNVVAYVVGFTLIQERNPPLKDGERRVPKNWLPKGVWRDVRFYSLMGSVFVGVWGYLVSCGPFPVDRQDDEIDLLKLRTDPLLLHHRSHQAAVPRVRADQSHRRRAPHRRDGSQRRRASASSSLSSPSPPPGLTLFLSRSQVFGGYVADRIGPINTLFLSFFIGVRPLVPPLLAGLHRLEPDFATNRP